MGLTVCLAVLVLIFAGCGSASDTGAGTSTAATEQTATASGTAAPETKDSGSKTEPVTIRVFNRVNAQVVIENNPVLQEVEKEANVKLEYEAPPINNYVDKLQIVMASGDIPDLIYNWGTAGNGADANMETWAANGLLAALDDKIGNYPNLMKNITPDMWKAVKSVNDGKTYIVPRTNVVNHWGYMVNQQWLDKLGLKAPTTLDEFTAVCKAFTEGDPDGNGKPDTFGVTFSNPQLGSNSIWNSSYFLAAAFDLPIVNGAKDTDGKYKIKEKMSGYIPYLTYLKQLNDEKIIDPEFLINKIYVDAEKINQNRVGICYNHQYGVVGNSAKAADSYQRFSYYAPLKDAKGVSTDLVIPAMWGGWMISSSSKNIDAILAFLDWGNTAEANQLLQIGIKGEHYDSYDPATKQISRTKEQAEKVATVTSTYMTLANAIDGSGSIIEGADTPEKFAKYTSDFEAASKVFTTINLPAVRSPKILNLNAAIPDLVKEKDDQEVAYITGKITLDQFKDFLEKKWYPATADAEKEYVDAMNKLAQ
jgi:putative aldouronate transport system substrate-binding protein